jgi:hypothetical protein
MALKSKIRAGYNQIGIGEADGKKISKSFGYG